MSSVIIFPSFYVFEKRAFNYGNHSEAKTLITC